MSSFKVDLATCQKRLIVHCWTYSKRTLLNRHKNRERKETSLYFSKIRHSILAEATPHPTSHTPCPFSLLFRDFTPNTAVVGKRGGRGVPIWRTWSLNLVFTIILYFYRTSQLLASTFKTNFYCWEVKVLTFFLPFSFLTLTFWASSVKFILSVDFIELISVKQISFFPKKVLQSSTMVVFSFCTLAIQYYKLCIPKCPELIFLILQMQIPLDWVGLLFSVITGN